MEDIEDQESVRSELRYITIELMKISSEQKRPFDKVASEFMQNTYKLNSMIEESISNPSKFKKEANTK